MFKINDLVIVVAHWKNKQHLRCKIVSFWSPNGLFLDVEPLEGEKVIRCVRRDDILGFSNYQRGAIFVGDFVESERIDNIDDMLKSLRS
jgi:hypothetical protein